MTIVCVALDLPLPRVFDYLAADSSESDIGYRVTVPFGRSFKTGVIVGWKTTSDQPADRLKTVVAILRDMPPLPGEWLALCKFCAAYYQASLGEVCALALPPMLRRGKLPREIKAKPNLGVAPAPTFSTSPALLPDQQSAMAEITVAKEYRCFLLHGVTGSGKTEVYLHAIAEVLGRGGQVLMLVPEIALTPQLENRVRTRFPSARLVVANSSVADAARARGFLDALSGRADIILGTRLAVFIPLPRLRLIVVDEEHDTSFKQQDGPRYSARDLAIWRAHQLAISIVLGSATPALETYHHAREGRYRLLDLPLRAVAEAPPTVHLIDIRREKLRDGLSQAFITALELRLARGEQSLVFLNRRGYAPVLACSACGWISRCHRCAANLVVHLADARLRCHHCGFEATLPRACPDCGNLDLQPFGRGTQRLEAALATLFPQARILRIDRDSANTPKKWQTLLASIHSGEADILVGTQMLAKGHDFPQLTLVGAVGADAALFAADFRAPERLFSQLMQVGGRSGRADLAGEVLIQTEYPDHPLYQALADHDYARFARSQLEERRSAGFPPFTFQALLRAESPAMAVSLEFLERVKGLASTLLENSASPAGAPQSPGNTIVLYDPVPMRLQRLMALERAQLLVESVSRAQLQNFVKHWVSAIHGLKPPRDLRWHIDVDPLEF
ncbi:MAG: primosomal protein N' [Betaproteobacteria bacterium HGW-Betaproteobacteria-11]|nr:MAG: primosomal protein N' [Betaproteobacteria bacterium HGW-Betaproteobacteria-11]